MSRFSGHAESRSMTAGRMVDIDLSLFNCGIAVCSICNGYLREACTISECYHAFCKSCIYLYFYSVNGNSFMCPTCSQDLGPNPYKYLKDDRSLQEVLRSVLPNSFNQDKVQEAKFYERYGVLAKNQSQNSTNGKSINVEDSAAGFKGGMSVMVSGDNTINIQLLPEVSVNTPDELQLPSIPQKFLRVDGGTAVLTIKELIAKAFRLMASEVVVCCDGVALRSNTTVNSVYRTQWADQSLIMILQYRKKRKT